MFVDCLLLLVIPFRRANLNVLQTHIYGKQYQLHLIISLLLPYLLSLKSTFNQTNQLDFLLNKASEYSNFIANDLAELQSSLAAEAELAQQTKESGGKKRKSAPGDKKKKKRKKNNGEPTEGEVNLAAAQAKAEVGKKPIFIQPSNLANGCVLKDYQLEGVRWLVSLYENGVSGILADEMVRNTTYC